MMQEKKIDVERVVASPGTTTSPENTKCSRVTVFRPWKRGCNG